MGMMTDHLHEIIEAKDAKIAKLESDINSYRMMLRLCYNDYSHPSFTDRHGMADRIKRTLDDP